MSAQKKLRYEDVLEFIRDLRQPGKVFSERTRPPLYESNPVAVWQSISLILFLCVLYLLN